MNAPIKPKRRKCKAKGCDVMVTIYNSLQPFCSPQCGYAVSQQVLAEKANKERLRVKRERLDTKRKFRENDRSWWLKKTQADVNAYCRWRDRDKPCITCDKPPEATDKFVKGSGRDAGHYLTRAAYSALRFDTRQIFAQCVTCNRYNSGRRHEFRLAMVDMHGLEFVEWLESQRQPKTWEIDELKAIREKYRQLLRDAGIKPP